MTRPSTQGGSRVRKLSRWTVLSRAAPRRLSRLNLKRLARTKATSGLQRGTLSCSNMAARNNPRLIGLISTCPSRLPRSRSVEVVAAQQGRPLQAAPHPLSSIRPSSEGFHRRVLPVWLSHLHSQPLSEVVSGSPRRQPQPHNRLRGAEAACSGLVSRLLLRGTQARTGLFPCPHWTPSTSIHSIRCRRLLRSNSLLLSSPRLLLQRPSPSRMTARRASKATTCFSRSQFSSSRETSKAMRWQSERT